jgi:hypothetical protein
MHLKLHDVRKSSFVALKKLLLYYRYNCKERMASVEDTSVEPCLRLKFK